MAGSMPSSSMVIGFTALSVFFANVPRLALGGSLEIVPVTFLFANFFEWWIHRFVMHRPVAGEGRSARSTTGTH